MLTELRIQNFAIIDRLEVHFATGFNVITGETGAGKSIIIDAVDMMLGGRADSELVRAGNDKATVEGIFSLSDALLKDILPLLESQGIEIETPSRTPDQTPGVVPVDTAAHAPDLAPVSAAGVPPGTVGEIMLTRELRSNGRSTCRINGSAVSLQFYKEVGDRLVDVHGQSEHLSLLNVREHINLLDRYAGVEPQRARIAELVTKLSGLRAEIEALTQDEAAIARRIDMLQYQIEEIRAVGPKLGEEEQVRDECNRLANSEQLANLTEEAHRSLETDDDTVVSAVDRLSITVSALIKLAKIDPGLNEQVALAEGLVAQAEDLAAFLRRYHDSVEFDPHRLAELEERLDALNRLKRKYGGTIEAVIAYGEKCRKELENITHSEERLAELRTIEDRLLHEIGDLAAALSARRLTASAALARAIETELAELRMEGTRFEAAITQVDDPQGCYAGERRLKFDPNGIDHVEFQIAANRGEPLRPLVKVASGGETARIMLALKSVLSRADRTPTLIFDEIDQGIGGRVGSIVGQKLWNLAVDHQVLCVTHLAQLAGFGDAHFKVTKGSRGDRVVTAIQNLDDRARVDEIAEMLGAETSSARQSAHDILMLARRAKEGQKEREKGIQSALL
ncbi:MAG TPA: DNA repair protein RecN [Aggregatilineales bacterium]|nr:DNA repair protein RecN [Aggregatilineales bacterium]